MDSIPEFDWRRAAILRMLLYPVQFDCYPLDGIDRVLSRDVLVLNSKLWTNDVIAAIDAGLASHAKLSELIPMNHSEQLIRTYFATMRARLMVNHPLRSMPRRSSL